MCPRKSYRNYSRSSSSGNDAPELASGVAVGAVAAGLLLAQRMNIFCAKQGDVQSRLDET